jgi:Ca2+-binding RTX toxin-like protein
MAHIDGNFSIHACAGQCTWLEDTLVIPLKLTRLPITLLFLLCFICLEGSAQAAYTLTTVPDPIQGGMVAPNCSVGCIKGSGTTVGLFAIPSAGHIFGGWSGACYGMNPTTSVTMAADRICTVGFTACTDQPVEIDSTGYRSDLGSAYSVADDGDEIKLLAANLPESPNLNRQVSVTIRGGYGCGFSASQSMTLIQGPLTIGKGPATLENLVIVGTLSAASGVPPAIPSLPEATGFDNIINDPAVSGNATQTATGTGGSDRITQYGGTGTVVQTATGDVGDDWILQVCSGTSCNQTVDSGEGIDTVYQFGGPGITSQFISGTGGDKTYVQVGGANPNTQIAFGSAGIDRIFQYGGASKDLMSGEGRESDDHIEQYGQGGDDTMVIEGGTGNDEVYQSGGDGNDTLVVSGGNNDDVIFQAGGAGNDSLNCLGGENNDNIHQSGGDGDDAVRASPGFGVDLAYIDGGRGNDSITYDNEFDNTDTVEIDGGEGIDRTTITHYSAAEIYRIVDGNGSTIYETGNGGSVITVRNMEFLTDYGNAGKHTNDNVVFSLSFAAGSLNSVPIGADRVTISINAAADTRVYRLTPDLGSTAELLTVSFVAVAGDHTYTAKAWSGNTLLGTIGPISFTTVDGFPLTIPMSFAFTAFDSYHADIGEATSNTFTFFGTEGRERVVQYGGAANDTLYVESGAGNDWVEQYGGAGDDGMLAESGTENDYIMQVGGDGKDNIKIAAGWGDDRGFQYGGAGDDNIETLGSDGNDAIFLDGGDGGDTIYANPGLGNNAVTINAGAGNDSITYEAGPGSDTAFIDGGTGADSLTARENGNPLRIVDDSGNTLYQSGSGGTVITVANLEQITVLDVHGNTLFTWSGP